MMIEGKSIKKRPNGLSEKNFALLQTLLVQKRGEILNQVRDLENRWQEMAEPQIEAEEMAQEAEITEPYTQLDESKRREVQEIDVALKKMETGMYGNCEVCRLPITMKRLKAIPWTRYCLKDAEKSEKVLKGIFPTRGSD